MHVYHSYTFSVNNEALNKTEDVIMFRICSPRPNNITFDLETEMIQVDKVEIAHN